jgi:large-conductance mechanosensitive channel
VLIDWFTVVAQVINFLILVWLLKHFLYQPILDAIDAREKRRRLRQHKSVTRFSTRTTSSTGSAPHF